MVEAVVGMALAAELIDGNPERAQRLDVHQEIVHDNAHITPLAEQRIGNQHPIQSAEGVVCDEDIAIRGGQIGKQTHAARDLQLSEDVAQEIGRLEPLAREDKLVDTPLVKKTAQQGDSPAGKAQAGAGADYMFDGDHDGGGAIFVQKIFREFTAQRRILEERFVFL